jgi:hypothetical protein
MAVSAALWLFLRGKLDLDGNDAMCFDINGSVSKGVDMASAQNKWTEARDRLIRNVLRKPTFGTVQPLTGLEELEADTKRLIYVLNVASEGDPKVYSLALQSYLAFRGISLARRSV